MVDKWTLCLPMTQKFGTWVLRGPKPGPPIVLPHCSRKRDLS